MKARLYYKQSNKNNWWYFFLGDFFTAEQLTRAFKNKEEVKTYAINNNIEYNNYEMKSIFI